MSHPPRPSPIDVEISISQQESASHSALDSRHHDDESTIYDEQVSGVLFSFGERVIEATNASQMHEKEKSFARETVPMNTWKPEWAFSGNESEKDEARIFWFIFFFSTIVCVFFAIVTISTAAIYSIPSTTPNSGATFRYGYFSACVVISKADNGTNTSISCDSYSSLQTSLNAQNISDFQPPSALSAAKSFSVIEVISLGFLVLLIIFLLRSSSSSFILLRVFFLCIFILVCTIISLVCLIVSSSDRILMFGGAFQVMICLTMAAEAITALMLMRRGQKFAGICSSGDHELVNNVNRL